MIPLLIIALEKLLKNRFFKAILSSEPPANHLIIFKQTDPLPVDYDKQYGFTRFAITLNDLQSDLVQFLPRSDTRFRPDQR